MFLLLCVGVLVGLTVLTTALFGGSPPARARAAAGRGAARLRGWLAHVPSPRNTYAAALPARTLNVFARLSPSARAATGRGVAQLGRTARNLLDRAPALRGGVVYAGLPARVADLVAASPLTAPAATGFRAWSESLSPSDAAALAARLGRFCAEAGAEPGWLEDASLAARPELRGALEEALALFAVATWRAAEARPEAERLRAFQNWLAAPERGANRAFGDRLYLALAARGMTDSRPDLLLAPERARRAYVREAVQTACSRDPQLLDAIISEAVAPTPGESAPAMPAAQEAAALIDVPPAGGEAEPASDAQSLSAGRPPRGARS